MFALYHTLIYVPLYNGLILLINFLPWADAGVVVVLFTIIVKLILFPLSYRSVKTQVNMKQVEGELNAIKEKYKDDKQEQAKQVMELYKAKGINPFAGVFLVLIQLPIIIALYSIFLRSGLPHINTSILFHFVKVPLPLNMRFLGLIDISKKSILLSIIAAVSQFFQITFAMPKPKPRTDGKPASFGDDLARSMHFQMRFMMPVVVFFISYGLSAVVALYWSISNLFAIGQELYIRRTIKR